MKHENAKKELQTFIATLEGEVKEQTSNETSLKTELEHLKAEMEENAELKNNLLNLEKKLAVAQNTIMEQVSLTHMILWYDHYYHISYVISIIKVNPTMKQKETHSQMELERDAALKEVEAKNASLSHLETQIKDLTQKLNAKPKEEVTLYF